MSKTPRRGLVIRESLRHVQGLEHKNKSLCVYCCDEDKMPPNPWEPVDVVCITAAHSTHIGFTHPHCAICYPALNSFKPSHGLYSD